MEPWSRLPSVTSISLLQSVDIIKHELFSIGLSRIVFKTQISAVDDV